MPVKLNKYCDWSPGVRRQLFGLTFREESGMRETIKAEPNAQTFVYFEADRVVSWGMFSTTYDHPDITYMAFTRRSERRKGYAKAVLLAAREWRKKHLRGRKIITYKYSSEGAGYLYGRYRV